jgi:mannose-6-phosphate isomerase-like protein (cupin superfamily)
MKRILIPVALSALALSLLAADPAAQVWKASTLKTYEKGLHDKSMKGALGDWGNHNASMNHREEDGMVEVHENQTDIMYIVSGEGTLVLGGKPVDLKQTAPGEFRAPSSTGGETKQVAPGDMVHIPAGVPHWFKIAKGTQITYLTYKVNK